MIVDCATLGLAMGYHWLCCSSCHSDDDEGWSSLSERYFYNANRVESRCYARLCCAAPARGAITREHMAKAARILRERERAEPG